MLLLQLAPPHLLSGTGDLPTSRCRLPSARLPGSMQSLHDGPGDVWRAGTSGAVHAAAAVVMGRSGFSLTE